MQYKIMEKTKQNPAAAECSAKISFEISLDGTEGVARLTALVKIVITWMD